MSNFEFSKYCTPAQLYLVLGAIGIGMGFFKNYGVETLLMKALFLVVWAWVLNWLCSKGFKAISWVLVLLPFILVLFTYFFVKDVAKEAFEDEGFFEGAINNKKPMTDQQKNDRDTATKLAYEKEREKRRQAKQGFEGFDEGYAMGRGRVRIPHAMGRIEGFDDEGFEDEGFEDEGFDEGYAMGRGRVSIPRIPRREGFFEGGPGRGGGSGGKRDKLIK